jgi:hypothetical protein
MDEATQPRLRQINDGRQQLRGPGCTGDSYSVLARPPEPRTEVLNAPESIALASRSLTGMSDANIASSSTRPSHPPKLRLLSCRRASSLRHGLLVLAVLEVSLTKHLSVCFRRPHLVRQRSLSCPLCLQLDRVLAVGLQASKLNLREYRHRLTRLACRRTHRSLKILLCQAWIFWTIVVCESAHSSSPKKKWAIMTIFTIHMCWRLRCALAQLLGEFRMIQDTSASCVAAAWRGFGLTHTPETASRVSPATRAALRVALACLPLQLLDHLTSLRRLALESLLTGRENPSMRRTRTGSTVIPGSNSLGHHPVFV